MEIEGQPEKTSSMAGIVEDVISVDVDGRPERLARAHKWRAEERR